MCAFRARGAVDCVAISSSGYSYKMVLDSRKMLFFTINRSTDASTSTRKG